MRPSHAHPARPHLNWIAVKRPARRETFFKGRRSEIQGLGIGAYAYYRRIVENQRSRLIDKIAQVARRINAPLEMIAVLEGAAAETQFSKSVDMVRDAIPAVLLINGHNPLTLLHSALSDGLHAKSDEQCLELATSIRVVLAQLAEKISAALKDDAEVKAALSALLNRDQGSDK